MIDWQRVAELRDEIGEDDFAEVVEIFLEEVESSLEALKNAPGEENLCDVMHFLKGSALNLGFSALGELCRDGEHMAAAGQSKDIDRPAILTCYQGSKEVFLAEQGAAAA